jgi:hypothetical protein
VTGDARKESTLRKTFASLVIMLMAMAMLAAPAIAHSKADSKADHKAPPKGVPTAPDLGVTELTLYAIEDVSTTITREGDVLTGDAAEEMAPEVGDRFIVTDTVYADAERTDEVGRNHIQCVVSEVDGELPETEPAEGEKLPYFRVSILCSGVLDLFGQGTLSWSGVTTFTSEDFEELTEEERLTEPFIVVAITGGTFDFVGASGEVAIFDEESPVEGEIWSRYEVTLQ